MRKNRFIAVCLLLAFHSWALPLYGQTDTARTSFKDDYLQKSIRQKKTGNTMIGIGAGLVLTAFLIPRGEKEYDGICILGWCEGDRYENEDLKGIVAVTGIGTALSSIFFYKASKRNARKATTMGLHMERAVQFSRNSIKSVSFPALRIQMRF